MKWWFLILCSGVSFGSRIKDISSIRGVRNNQLVGYGIVVGLAGTGDKSSELTSSSLGLALKGMGVDLKSPKLDTKNAAAVIVSSTLPAFAKVGTRLDVSVSSIGSASSLDGGVLLMTALRGPDGNVYSMAQGKVVTTKRSDAKATGQTLVTADVPGGGLLEKEIPLDFTQEREIRFHLLHPDFTTAARMARRINEEFGGKYATALDGGTVHVILPYHTDASPVELIAQLEMVDVEADQKAKVVVNQRTGTVVLGDQVRLSPVAIAHGNLKVEVKDVKPAAGGSASASATADEKKSASIMLHKGGVTISEVVAGLNEMGATSDDLIAMLQALKASGSLAAEVEIQ